MPFVSDSTGKHSLLATKDKLYLAKLSESIRENHWGQHEKKGGKPANDELKNKRMPSVQDDKSKEEGTEKTRVIKLLIKSMIKRRQENENSKGSKYT